MRMELECIFCKLKEDNVFHYGKIFHREKFSLHYYCMLFSSGLVQRGKTDKDGILGFLPGDILREVRRGKRLKCSYCRKCGATVGCCYNKCRKVFHFPCGLQNGSLSQFFGRFNSYCEEHRPRQKVWEENGKQSKGSELMCPICLYPVKNRDSNYVLIAPCCKSSWFHRNCLQRQALSAGYFFKCPLCNNKELFQMEMLKYGIHVPEQDASWELEQNAFQDLLVRYCHCDAPQCICPKGRNFNLKGSEWEIQVCRSCGSQGYHILCRKPMSQKSYWECEECLAVSKRLKQRWSVTTPNKMHDDSSKLEDVRVEDSSSEAVNLSKLVSSGKKKRKSEKTILLEKDSTEVKVSKNEIKEQTTPFEFVRGGEKMNMHKLKSVSLEGLLHSYHGNDTVLPLQDDSTNKRTEVTKSVSLLPEERKSEILKVSNKVINSDKHNEHETLWKNSSNMFIGKSDSLQKFHNTKKDFNSISLDSDPPIFFQVSRGINPDTYRLEVFMKRGDDLPPVKLGFRNLSVPSSHNNQAQKQLSVVTLEQLLNDSFETSQEDLQVSCAVPSKKCTFSNNDNQFKEFCSSKNKEHCQDSTSQKASKLQDSMCDQEVPHKISSPTTNKMYIRSKQTARKSLSKHSRKQDVYKKSDAVSAISSNIPSSCQTTELNTNHNIRMQECCSSKELSPVMDKSSGSENLSKDAAVNRISDAGFTLGNGDKTDCSYTSSPQRMPTNFPLTANKTTVSGKNNQVSAAYDKHQLFMRSQEISTIHSENVNEQVTKTNKVDTEITDKSINQKDSLSFVANYHTGGIQLITKPQEISIIQPENETQQVAEVDNEDLQVIIPEDINLIHPVQENEIENMEIQITNVHSLTNVSEDMAELGQMIEDNSNGRQIEESRAPNPRDLRTPSPPVFEISSSDESDCVILSDSKDV
ncbi:uncharacterized protein LOC143222967 isoform X3 [Tachypleus tridentatus]|uniref:uncharacterized protein LOC143222967 isoform X3 n=1 Tax=Tachypleus tridentatus TaxID=6853 RepID=UPI003FD00F82